MDYIHYAFNKFKRGLVYYAADGTAPFAFCLWKNRNMMGFDMNVSHTEIHILLICGKGAGLGVVPFILDDLVKICRRDNIQYISVEVKERYLEISNLSKSNKEISVFFHDFQVSKSLSSSRTSFRTKV